MRVLSVDVGYRNFAKVLGSVTRTDNNVVCVTIERAEVNDVLQGCKPKSIADTATKIVRDVAPWLESADEVVCEAQVRKSGMNFGLAHAILGAASMAGVQCTFMPAKAKFASLPSGAETNLKKRAIENVRWMTTNKSARLDLKNFVQPFTEARKKDDLADALLQLLTHVNFQHERECGPGDPAVAGGLGDAGGSQQATRACANHARVDVLIQHAHDRQM